MIGNLPRKPLLEFLEKVMLYLNSGNIAKALITKPRSQVLPQEK